MFFDNVKKLKEERDYWKHKYEELQAQIDEWDAQLAEEINTFGCEVEESEEREEESRTWRTRTTFKDLHIPVGTMLYFCKNSDEIVVTIDDNSHVRYQGEEFTITKIGCKLCERYNMYHDSGFNLFTLEPNGKTIFQIRKQMEIEGTYGE